MPGRVCRPVGTLVLIYNSMVVSNYIAGSVGAIPVGTGDQSILSPDGSFDVL